MSGVASSLTVHVALTEAQAQLVYRVLDRYTAQAPDGLAREHLDGALGALASGIHAEHQDRRGSDDPLVVRSRCAAMHARDVARSLRRSAST